MEKKSILDPMPFTVDSFFTTQEQRDEEKKEKVEEISIDLLDEFPNHPFKVLKNEELSKLEESIKDNGVLEPIIVRKKDDRYEIVSGHRRKLASTLVGLKSIPCIVRNMNDDEEDEYKIVGSQEADPFESKISNESPIAQALFNHKVGDIVTVDSPNGSYEVEIIDVK